MAQGSAEAVLQRFPKPRPELPPAYAAIYANQYKENRSGDTTAASMAQRLEQWMHRCVAADVRDGPKRATLEIGAGTLNQLPHEPEGGAYDIIEPFTLLYKDSPHRSRIRHVYADVSDVPEDHRYDRITSIAALEHIANLPHLLARSALLMSETASFRAAIPAEGGFLWWLGWNMTTGLEFRLRHGLDYGVIMRHEHLNNAAEIEVLVREIFEDVEVRSFGVGRDFSLYRFIEARKPRLDLARDWAKRFEP